MRARHNLVEIFSAFIEFELDYFSRWVTAPRLRRSMERCIATEEQPLSETLWANYWHHIHSNTADPQQTALANGHLAAYLQETCYWVTQKILKLLPDKTLNGADCFQIAIVEIETILAKYAPNRGCSLKGFAAIAYPRLLRDILRRRRTAEISTDPTLLMRVSRRCFLGALTRAGLSDQDMAPYRLVWNCFKVTYGQQSPSGATKQINWQAVATLYNRERQSKTGYPQLDAATVEERMGQCAQWIRAYLCPTIVSLQMPQLGEGDPQGAATQHQGSLLSELIAQEDALERQLQRSQINQVLIDAIAALKPHQQDLLRLYYQQRLTQKQIAAQLNQKQYSISRQLTRIRTQLLDVLVVNVGQWSAAAVHTELTADLSNSMSPMLEEWLMAYYAG